jgi:heavy metal-binding protein
MIKFKSLYLSVLFIVLLFSSSKSYSQHDHGSHGGSESHEQLPPMGGVLTEVGKYKVEMVVDMILSRDKLSFYLYKSKLKPISNSEISGIVTINYDDGNSIIDTLQAKGEYKFVAQMDRTDSFNCMVKFTVNGKIVSTVFSHQGFGQIPSDQYTCPMHSNITSSEPGKCPVCGMNLEK